MKKTQEMDVRTTLEGLIAKAGEDKILSAKDLVVALEGLQATEEQTGRIYEEIEAHGIHVDVSKITEALKLDEEYDPSNEDLLSVEEPLADLKDLSDGVDTNDPVRMYLKEIGNISMLTATEEQELAYRIRQGDEDAFRRMKRSAMGRRIRELDSFDSTCFRVCAYHLSKFDYFRFPEIYRSIEAKQIADFLAEAVKRERCSLSIINPLKEENV